MSKKMKERFTHNDNPIPKRVYYKTDTDNFYTNTRHGMGNDFYLKWKSRYDEFPQISLPIC